MTCSLFLFPATKLIDMVHVVTSDGAVNIYTELIDMFEAVAYDGPIDIYTFAFYYLLL